MNRFIVLGSSNAVPKIDQENTHLFVAAGDRQVLVDCGNNALVALQKKGIGPDAITDLILTHFHPDHAGSLPNLLMGMWLEKRTNPLAIHGLEFTLDRAKALLGLFGWANWANMYPVTFHTIPENELHQLFSGSDLTVRAATVKHLIPTIGVRFDFREGRSITYSCDTEPCESLEALAHGSDVLLQESAGPGKGHTSARQAGEVAAKAGVSKLVLIHYDQRTGAMTLVNEAKANFSGEVVAALDGMELY